MGRLAMTVALLLAVLRRTAADDSSPTPYPVWVTNDYNCVIGCISAQLGSATPPATQEQTDAALGCVRDACASDTAAGNIYQAHYIINMFNTIGSIYEPQSWQDGNAPNASDLTAPSGWEQVATTTAWVEDGQSTTVTASVWVPTTAEGSASADGASTSTGSSDSASATVISSAKASGSSAHYASSNSTSSSAADSSAQHLASVGVCAPILVAAGTILGATLFGALGVVGL